MSELTEVELPLARALKEGRHEIRRQVVCEKGRVDIFDDTTFEIIECKARGTPSLISDAINQLKRYYRCFAGPQLAVAVPALEPEAEWMRSVLEAAGVRLIEVQKGIGI